MAEKTIFTAETVEDAITKASIELGVTSDKLEVEVLDKGSRGFLGLGAREARISVSLNTKKKEKAEEKPAKADEKPEWKERAEKPKKAEEKPKKAEEKPKKEEAKEEKKTVKTTENDAAHFEEGKQFLVDVFDRMGMKVNVEYKLVEDDTLEMNLSGEEMGVLIGKRGQTLDSLQYLTSLVINRSGEHYIRVKLDTENYRERRKETLESLAKNIA